MRIRAKTLLSAAVLFVYLAWDNFGKPIWSVNVERWAEQRRLDQTLNDNLDQLSVPVMPSWIVDLVNFLTGDFMLGAACLGLLFLSIDASRWAWSAYKNRKKETLNPSTLAEKCKEMAALIRANQPFLGGKYYNSIYIKIDLYDLTRKIERLINRKGLSEINTTNLDEYLPVLDALAAAFAEQDQIEPDSIGIIVDEFESHRLPKEPVKEKLRKILHG